MPPAAADYYVGSLLEAGALLAREPVPGVEAQRLFGYNTGHYHFGVRKDWARLAEILDKGIHTLRARPNAELLALLGKLPAYLKVPAPLPLDRAEAALLSRRPVWRVGAVQGLALLNDIDASGLHGGIAAEYTAQVMQRLGVAMQVVAFENVAAMLQGLRDGRIDVVPFLTRTPEREREFTFSIPYVEMPYLLVARSNGPLYWDLASLRGKRVALAHAHPLREVLAQRHPDIRIVDAPNGTVAMDRVARGEAEAAVEVKLFANLRINSDTAQALRAVAAVGELPAQFHFATRRADEQLLPVVNRALADIAPDERERMLRRWVAIDLNPPFPWRRHLPLLLAIAAGLLTLAAATSWWMRRLAREVQARRRSEQLLSDIAATVPGIAYRYVFNADGTLRSCYHTPGVKSFLGIELDPKRTVLQTLAPRLRPEHVQAADAQWRRSVQTGEPFKISGAYAHPDGGERWLHAEAVRTGERDGRAVWTGFIVDISTERELQQRLQREAEARNLLLASASHELRAPTHTLSLALQSLREDGLDAAQCDALRIANDSARTLGQLLNDVLDAARLDRGELRLAPRDFDLHALIHEVAGAWRAAAASKGLAFDSSIASGRAARGAPRPAAAEADSHQPAQQRLQVHRGRQRLAARRGRGRCAAHRRRRHRQRHRRDAAGAAVRAVRVGRRAGERRQQRARTVDLPAARRADVRHDRRRQRARARHAGAGARAIALARRAGAAAARWRGRHGADLRRRRDEPGAAVGPAAGMRATGSTRPTTAPMRWCAAALAASAR